MTEEEAAEEAAEIEAVETLVEAIVDAAREDNNTEPVPVLGLNPFNPAFDGPPTHLIALDVEEPDGTMRTDRHHTWIEGLMWGIAGHDLSFNVAVPDDATGVSKVVFYRRDTVRSYSITQLELLSAEKYLGEMPAPQPEKSPDPRSSAGYM